MERVRWGKGLEKDEMGWIGLGEDYKEIKKIKIVEMKNIRWE